MIDSVIQDQIKLVAFKATKVSFLCSGSEPRDTILTDFVLDLENLVFRDDPKHFAKIFKIRLSLPRDISEQISERLDFDIEFHTLFESAKPIDDQFLLSDFAKISAPAIGFPFLRAFITTFSVQAGFQPIILPSINFIEYNRQVESASANKAK